MKTFMCMNLDKPMRQADAVAAKFHDSKSQYFISEVTEI